VKNDYFARVNQKKYDRTRTYRTHLVKDFNTLKEKSTACFVQTKEATKKAQNQKKKTCLRFA